MKIEMLGHANLLVRTSAGSVLFDPPLLPTHHEGVYDVYPPRQLELERLPEFDAVVLSHAHADHFDLPSISLIPRHVPLLLPSDPEMLACLRGLGFRELIELESFEAVRIGELELIPTPPAAGALEHGLLLRSGELTVWNMVDTFPSTATIDAVLQAYGPVDLLFAPWQPLHDTGVSHGVAPHFPHRIYRRILATIAHINPRYLVPGACGFWAVGPAAWTNASLFPLTRERFLDDLGGLGLGLEQRTFPLDPGDALSLSAQGIAREHGLLDYIECSASYDWHARAFRPLELLGPPVREHRGAAACVEECGAALESLLLEALPAFIREHDQAFAQHRAWRVHRQYELVFDGGERRAYSLRFSAEGVEAEAGDTPLHSSQTVVSAGLLVALIASASSWEYAEMSGELRRFDFTYVVDERGLHVPPRPLSDPLAVLLGSPSEREQYRATMVEALDEHYREAIAQMGLSPEEAFGPREPALEPASPYIDATAIASSIIEKMGITPGDMQQE